MLLRAAGRRHQRRPSPRLATHIQSVLVRSPALACSRWGSATAKKPSGASPATPSRDTHPNHVRTLASIASHAEVTNQGPDPFDYKPSSEVPILDASRFEWPKPAWGAEDPLILQLRHEVPRQRRSALGTLTADLLQHLYACLRVGRFDRAESVIKKLGKGSDSTDSEVMHAHEAYLESRAQRVSGDMIKQELRVMRKWYNDHSLSNKPGNLNICLIMMRMALIEADPERRDTWVKKYAEESGVDTQELVENLYWSDREYLMVGAILNERPMPSEVNDSSIMPAEAEKSTDKSTDDSLQSNEAEFQLTEQDVPEVLQVQQRGLSVTSLKSVLKLQEDEIVERRAGLRNLTPEEIEARDYARERLLEEATADAALANWRAEAQNLRDMGVNHALSSKSINALMWQWYSDLVPVLEAELANIKTRLDTVKASTKAPQTDADLYGIYIDGLKAEQLAITTVVFIMSAISQEHGLKDDPNPHFLKIGLAAANLGSRLEGEVLADAIKKERQGKSKAGKRRQYGALRNARFNARQLRTQGSVTSRTEWPTSAKVRIGAMLLSKLMEVAKMPITKVHPKTKESITRSRPAFAHKTIFLKGRRHAMLAACEELREKLRKEPVGAFIAKRLPMLVKPNDWTGFRQGGYLNYMTDFVRLGNDLTPKEYAIAAIERGHMDRVFEAINALGRVPWKINKDVLRVQLEAWNTGEQIANFAPVEPKIEAPPEPDRSSDPNVRVKWIKQVQDIENVKAGYHSQRCHQNLQLEIARAFRNDTVYFPHNVDFRGRAYPIPPYLNHMGADNARALMTFQQGKEIGALGLKWLKVHLSNVFGYDKASFSEREKFVDDHMDDIRDSAENPLSGRRWWLQSEDAWQTLAACFELTNAMNSPDPEKFVSHLPIHQDGTCNGLQHYAALGGDEAGARQVNLVPGDRPSDVYTAVAEGVIASIEKDLEDGNQLAKMVHGRITRKVVKQPVMTNVYGVTYYGARAQVEKQLHDIFPEIKSTDLVNHKTLAAYIAKKIFNSLGEMFRGAQAIQEWLGVCADRIATSVSPEQISAFRDQAQEGSLKAKKKGTAEKSMRTQFKSTVVWTTPLKFPVAQPYRDCPAKALQTHLSSVLITEPQAWDPVSRRKQMQGFPPNFIHSLDATHMMLSASMCDKKGLTFAAIHDSFWTHASDRDELSELLRDAFVHMHSEDVVGRLKEEFEARYKDYLYLAQVENNGPAAERIKEWRADAKTKAALKEMGDGISSMEREMLLEAKRLRLLSSDSPEEVQQGKEMVTPCTIWLDQGDESKIVPTHGIANARLGAASQDTSKWAAKEGSLQELVDHIEEESSGLHESDEECGDLLESDDGSNAAENEDSGAADGQTFEAEEEVLKCNSSPDKDVELDGHLATQARMRLLGQDPNAQKRRSTSKQTNKTRVWLPLTFPEVPQKGGFDVRTLRQSKYFFH